MPTERQERKFSMSIALEAKVASLERTVIELSGRTVELMTALREAKEAELHMTLRLNALEAARKPGPKPKDSNG
jgi:hypothetical protein